MVYFFQFSPPKSCMHSSSTTVPWLRCKSLVSHNRGQGSNPGHSIWGSWRIGAGTGFSPSISVFPRQYQSTNPAWTFIYNRRCIISATETVVNNALNFFFLSCTCHMPSPSHLPSLNHLNIRWGIQSTKLNIILSSPDLCYFTLGHNVYRLYSSEFW